jgi:hypothetical protein
MPSVTRSALATNLCPSTGEKILYINSFLELNFKCDFFLYFCLFVKAWKNLQKVLVWMKWLALFSSILW